MHPDLVPHDDMQCIGSFGDSAPVVRLWKTLVSQRKATSGSWNPRPLGHQLCPTQQWKIIHATDMASILV